MAGVGPAEEGRLSALAGRTEKVKAIFAQFDKNSDGRLSKEEMAALVVAVNPSVRFSEDQIAAILEEVFKTYGEFIDHGGLSLAGLRRTYDDGAGDVDRDFDALGLTLEPVLDDDLDLKKGGGDDSPKKGVEPPPDTPALPAPELSEAVKALVQELDTLLQRGVEITGDALVDQESQGKLARALAEMRHRADTLRSPEESFDAHMEMGAVLGAHGRWEEALLSYRRAIALRPEDARAHFRIGNALYSSQKFTEARDSYGRALDVARTPTDSKLLPQIHVNMGVAMEADGFMMGACEHYREAAILNPQQHRALKLLGSALYSLGELRAAEEALQHAVNLRPDYADAQVDLGNALYGLGELESAVACFQKAIELNSSHTEALFNLGNVRREQSQFEAALELYNRMLLVDPTNWKGKLNRSVCLLALGRGEDESLSAFKEVYKKTGKRAEIYEAIKVMKKSCKAKGWNTGLMKKLKSVSTGSTHGQPPQARAISAVDAASKNVRFSRADASASTPEQVAVALEIRAVEKITKLGTCIPTALRREASDDNLPDDRRPQGSAAGSEGKIVRKANVERIFRRLLDASVGAQAFAEAMKHINCRVLAVLDKDEMGTVDLGKVLAVAAVLCQGPIEERKRAAYDILLWRSKQGMDAHVPREDALSYFHDLSLVYKVPNYTAPDLSASGNAGITFQEFSSMIEDESIGFPYLSSLQKIESFDRFRHHGMICAATGYHIVGPRYHCVNGNFDLCASSYAAHLVPTTSKFEEYIFKEYLSESSTKKLSKFACYSPHSELVME
ncbi:hypothetical protein CYMTET_38302 [Cymbomonas tetramitiformis]|uniref:EF-hand domain-containing protein n=2 Tax=Cymbomonas tetramitiformis TaxID=36881 RepID=A0AAE0F531_9CHLO|nr:hypothetical protein CYMTET_38302 [Cymbomonas tetramitiformis]|eukprot:gene14946-17666_t